MCSLVLVHARCLADILIFFIIRQAEVDTTTWYDTWYATRMATLAGGRETPVIGRCRIIRTSTERIPRGPASKLLIS